MELAQSLIEKGCHVCAFFQRPNEEFKILIPFLKEGVETGDKVVEILDPTRRPEHVRRLTEAGVPVKRVLGRGQLELRDWQDSHLRTGRFDRHDMTALIEEIATKGEQWAPASPGCGRTCNGRPRNRPTARIRGRAQQGASPARHGDGLLL